MLSSSHSDHADLLARAHAALAAIIQPDHVDHHCLLADLTVARDAFALSPVPWPVSISIGRIEHSHGLDIYVAQDRKALDRELADYCRERWSETKDPRDPSQLDDDTIIETYFDAQRLESLTVETATLEPPPARSGVGGLGGLESGRYCVLSSAHLTSTTGDLLDDFASWPPADRPLDIASAVHGWFVPTRAIAPERAALLPDDLTDLMRFGRDRGFDYVLVDCDGDEVDDLKTHSW